MTWTYLLMAFFGLLGLLLIVVVFRHGARSTYLDRIPLFKLVFCTFGVMLLDSALDWIAAEPERNPLTTQLVVGGFYFFAGCGVWLAGFCFGRWRGAKRQGVVSRH